MRHAILWTLPPSTATTPTLTTALQGGKAKLLVHMGELVESDFTYKSGNRQTKKQSRSK
ncbi:TPA: hypothetical protein ACH3X2_006721 [Trebouxia sp. C0005]